jgi:serine/threonine protein kinase
MDVNMSQSEMDSPFFQKYQLGEILGKGAFSVVRECVDKATGTKYACKCISKQSMGAEDLEGLMQEKDIMLACDHPNIIKLYEFFDEEEHYYMVLENMTGGELFDRIVAKNFYNELDARECIHTVLEALNYIHSNKIAHRDLKPENLLLASMDDDHNVKLADFGFAKKCNTLKCLSTQCGTPGYVAPEILRGKQYDYSADMWSIGVIMYIIIGGYPPFYEDNQQQLFDKIKAADYEFHREFWDNISDDAKDLISRCICLDVDARITCEQAINHPWLKKESRALSSIDLHKNLEEFKRFNAKRKFKGGVKAVMANNKMKRLLQAARSGAEESNKAAAAE